MSITLDAEASIALGDLVLVRGRDEYHRQAIETLQVKREAVHQATGPGAVGIGTTLTEDFARTGSEVYVVLNDEVTPSE